MMSCLQLTQFKISYFILKEGWGECILAGGLRFCQARFKQWALMNMTFAQADPIKVQKG